MSIFTHGSSGSTSLLDTKVDHGSVCAQPPESEAWRFASWMQGGRAGRRAGSTKSEGVGEPDATIPTYPKAGPDRASRGRGMRVSQVWRQLCMMQQRRACRSRVDGMTGRRECEGECEFEKEDQRKTETKMAGCSDDRKEERSSGGVVKAD